MDLQQLKHLGFVHAGQFVLSDDTLIAFESIDEPVAGPLVYVMTDDEGKCIYVGKFNGKHSRDLASEYVNGNNPSNQTRFEVKRLIRAELDEHGTIDLYAAHPDERVFYKGYELNVVEGLEQALIDKIDPIWNGNTRGPLLERLLGWRKPPGKRRYYPIPSEG